MIQEIRRLQRFLNLSDAQLLLMAREAAQDKALASMDLMGQLGRAALLADLYRAQGLSVSMAA